MDGQYQYSINLLGGEPLLHPEIFDLALLTREIMPECICFIPTNGIFINNLSDEQLIKYFQNGIRLGITLYPKKNLLKMYHKLKERFEKLNLSQAVDWNFSRVMFDYIYFDEKIPSEKEECFNYQIKYTSIVNIYKEKIYNCQNAFFNDRFYNSQKDYFSINLLKPHSNIKSILTKNDCNNCSFSINEPIFWHLSNELPKEIEFKTLKDLYLNYYDSYYILKHDCKEHLECMQDEFFQRYFTPYVSSNIFYSYITRFIYGQGDILIILNQKISPKILEKLKSTEYKFFNFYFIDISKNKDIEEFNYDVLLKEIKNPYFLKADSYQHAYKVFEQNSYLKNKIIL